VEHQQPDTTYRRTGKISIHNIEVMLISETPFTEKNYLELPDYTVYHMNHPAKTAEGGAAK
jgi:hypothetical protein